MGLALTGKRRLSTAHTIAVIDWIEIPRRSNTEVCYSFHSEAREVRGSETAQPGGILT